MFIECTLKQYTITARPSTPEFCIPETSCGIFLRHYIPITCVHILGCAIAQVVGCCLLTIQNGKIKVRFVLKKLTVEVFLQGLWFSPLIIPLLPYSAV
jgi:hypothetical protein